MSHLLASLVSVSSLFLYLQAALQKQQEVAVAGAALPTSSKVNAAAPSDVMPVNGQAKPHTDSSEKEPEPEAAEEALENGPKGMTSRWRDSDSMKAEIRRSGEQPLRAVTALRGLNAFSLFAVWLWCFWWPDRIVQESKSDVLRTPWVVLLRIHAGYLSLCDRSHPNFAA